MANTVLVLSRVAAKNVDALNRSFVSANAIQNGAVFASGALSTAAGKKDVFTISNPATGALGNLWMAASPEVVTITSNGKNFKGIDNDPRDFTNIANEPFSGFKPQVGDIIQITVDGLNAAYAAGTEYAVATDGSNILTWNASAITGLSFKYLATVPINIANGGIGNNAVAAYLLECVAN